MSVIYAGSTPVYSVRILDESGVQLDPSNLAQVVEVKIFIYNSITGAEIGKFYLNTLPEGTGWTKLPAPKSFGAGDIRVMLPLSSSQTRNAEGNSNMIQIDAHVVDSDAWGGVRIDIRKGKFSEVQPAKS
jgi:hypothetical protein